MNGKNLWWESSTALPFIRPTVAQLQLNGESKSKKKKEKKKNRGLYKVKELQLRMTNLATDCRWLSNDMSHGYNYLGFSIFIETKRLDNDTS